MAYRYYGPVYFINPETREKFTCYSQGTSYGFRHIAFKGLEPEPTRRKPDARRSYYNRTWECFEFESVLKSLTGDTDKLQRRI